MKRNNLFSDFFSDLLSISNELEKNLKERSYNNVSDVESGEHTATYSYGDIESAEKKNVIVKHMDHWSDVARRNPNSKYEITFKFGNDEVFYFVWNADAKKFVTKDPNGDEFYYNDAEKTLEKISHEAEEKKDVESKKIASGVRSDVVDNTVSDVESEDTDEDEYYPDYNLGDISADHNLAFNLRTELNKWKENNQEDEDCDVCDQTFCPYTCCDTFKERVMDPGCFDADFDEDGNVYQIKFPLHEYFDEYSDEDYIGILQEVYHKESINLDKFCELMKEQYGFSLGSWNVEFEDEKRTTVKNIEFIFTF